jgi:hypothetical protein
LSQLKRFISILLLLLFFLGTTGMPLNVHYCGNMLAGLSIAQQTIDDSDCCGDKDDCCSDQEVKIDVDKDYLGNSFKQITKGAKAILTHAHSFVQLQIAAVQFVQHNAQDYSPPDYLQARSLQVLHCSFLI